MDIQADIKFAQGCEEFKNQSQLLRYVAALNPEATAKEFVAACVDAGYLANSSANRFRESRKFWSKNMGGTVDSEGRYFEEVV